MSCLGDPASCLDHVSHFWYGYKLFFERAVGFSHDALHVIIGVCLQLVLAAVLRVSVRHPAPWLIVAALELANEMSDMHLQGADVPLQMAMGESTKDILLTLFLPTVILIAARWRPKLFK